MISRSAARLLLFIFVLLDAPGNCQTINEQRSSPDDWRKVICDGSLEQRRKVVADTLYSAPELQRQLLPDLIELLQEERDGQIRLAVFDTLTAMGPAATPAVAVLIQAMEQSFGGRYNEELHQDYRAALALAAIGQPAVEPLRALLDEERENLQAEAAMALGRIGAPAASAIPELISLLEHPSVRVQNDAIEALAAIGSAARPALLKAALSEDSRVRAGALNTIGRGELCDAELRSVVKTSLGDPDVAVRSAAVEASAQIGFTKDQLCDLLLHGIEDPHADVRHAAINILVSRPDLLQRLDTRFVTLLYSTRDGVASDAAFLLSQNGPRAVPLLLEAARDKGTRIQQLSEAIAGIPAAPVEPLLDALDDSNLRVKQVAFLALGQVRPVDQRTLQRLQRELFSSAPESLPYLLAAFESLGATADSAVADIRRLLPNSTPEVRCQIIDILFAAAPHDQQLVEDVLSILDDSDPGVRQHGIAVLQSMGAAASRSVPEVVYLLQDLQREVRIAVVRFLGTHGAAASIAVSELKDLLEPDDAELSVAVLQTLGKIGPPSRSATDTVLKYVRSDSPEIREAAIEALSQLELELAELQDPLLRSLQDPIEGVRNQAARTVRRLGQDGLFLLPHLIPLVSHEDKDIADSITRVLERMERYAPGMRVLKSIATLTESQDPAVQKLTIRFFGLGGAEAEFAIQRLQKFVEHPNESIREETLAALETIKGKRLNKP